MLIGKHVVTITAMLLRTLQENHDAGNGKFVRIESVGDVPFLQQTLTKTNLLSANHANPNMKLYMPSKQPLIHCEWPYPSGMNRSCQFFKRISSHPSIANTCSATEFNESEVQNISDYHIKSEFVHGQWLTCSTHDNGWHILFPMSFRVKSQTNAVNIVAGQVQTNIFFLDTASRQWTLKPQSANELT